MGATAATDVVVVGGGVIGLAVAWKATSAGLSVAVVDPRPGRGASWAAAGMLAPVGEAHFGEDALTRLNLEAARAWPEFARELEAASGRSVGYVDRGTLLVAVDPSDRAAVDDLCHYRAEIGLATTALGSRQCRALEPLLAPGIRGGADLLHDHQVDNRRVVEALIDAVRAGHVELVDDDVSAVEVHGGRATGVRLARGGRCAAGSVVVAAGCHSGRLDGIPAELRPPVRPVQGLTLRLRAPDDVPVLRRTVRGVVHGRSCYLVPRADRTVVIGATVEERGFDLAVRVGAAADLLDDARRLVPALDQYELVDTTTGLRPGSPDNGPMVGPGGLPGLVVATGHYRNGILLAPLTATEVVGVLRSGDDRPEGPWAAFRPDRFVGTGRSPDEPSAAERRPSTVGR
jgi:glycine oxidase